MIELPLVFVAGILGTAHCLGMCGPFALAIGGASSGWQNALARQLAYTAGRVFTYATLGAIAGFCGARLTQQMPALVNVPALLAIIAGVCLVVQGLQAAGWLPRWAEWKAHGQRVTAASCLTGGMLRPFLRQRGNLGVFLAGLFTGLLPCGLLYGLLALATSTHHPLGGATLMSLFGLGTAPGMLLAGMGGRLVSVAARRTVFAAAAWCLVLTGVISVSRGMSFLSWGASGEDRAVARCPLCP